MLIDYAIDTYSECHWASPLCSEIDSEILHLLGMLAILEIPLQIKNDVWAYISIRIWQYFKYYGKKSVEDKSSSPIGQAITQDLAGL